MGFPPAVRRAVLVAHVITAVGWMGAVAAFLALAIRGLRTSDVLTAQASYISMQGITRLAIVPLCWASLVIGVVQSLGSAWGLFRHYWVIAKLLITVLSTAILMLHVQPIAFMANAARTSPATLTEHRGLQVQLAVDAALAIVALLTATILAVYKPRGLTPYGWRQQRAVRYGRGRALQ